MQCFYTHEIKGRSVTATLNGIEMTLCEIHFLEESGHAYALQHDGCITFDDYDDFKWQWRQQVGRRTLN